MRDFTLESYSQYLSAIKSHYKHILRFDEYFSLDNKPSSFCLIRHDVDRKPQQALRMAELEYNAAIRSSYYFRAKSHTFKPEIIRAIAELGHETGYHYESLSDTNGDRRLAHADFEYHLKRFREFVPVKTIAMHGRPLKKYDNRDLWRAQNDSRKLKEEFAILGEVYLDIDYTDIAYISDTGRNWQTTKSNIRDITNSEALFNFKTGGELLQFLKTHPHHKMVFQIHPERWADSWKEYLLQYSRDIVLNTCKNVIKEFRND